jgi:hypothetical protein
MYTIQEKIRGEDKERQEGAPPVGASVGAGGQAGSCRLAGKTGWARGRQASVALPVVAAGRMPTPVPGTAVGKACALPWRGLVRGEKPAFTVLTPTFRAALGSFRQIRQA